MIRGLLMLSRGPACQLRANYVRLSYHPMAALSTTSSFKQDDEDQFGTIRKRRPPRKRESKQKAPQGQLQVPTTNTGVMDYGHFQTRPRVTTEVKDTETDTFGTLDPQLTQQLIASTGAGMQEEEEEEEKPHIRLSEVGRKNTPVWYGMKIERLGKEGKVSEAVDVLEVEMLQTDRVMPTRYVFTCLIGVLARARHTEKAFKLYNKMKKMGLTPEKPTYTALFNACANCLDKQEGWKRAEKLRGELVQKNITPNLVTYKAMIKAYGMCGDLAAAFSLVDELASHRYAIDGDVFKHLLIACISDTEAGSLHAVQVWQRMQKRHITPTTGHYNLLLRALRTCGFGDLAALPLAEPETSDHVTDETLGGQSEPYNFTNVSPVSDDAVRFDEGPPMFPADDLVPSQTADGLVPSQQPWWQVPDNRVVPVEETKQRFGIKDHVSILNSQRTNFLDLKPGRQQNVLQLVRPETPVERLACVGGMLGILQQMERHQAQPDVRTLTQLLDMLPNTPQAERDLISVISSHQVKPDTNFFNLIIRRRNKRQDYDGAMEVVLQLGQLALSPNLQTFRALAFGCSNHRDAIQLLKDMQGMDMVPDVELLCLLMNNSGQDFLLKRHLVVTMETLQIHPNERMLRMIEADMAEAEDAVVRKDRGGHEHLPKNFEKSYGTFRKYYSHWLKNMQLDDSHLPARANTRLKKSLS